MERILNYPPNEWMIAMIRAIDVAIIAVIGFIVIAAGFLAVPQGESTDHFGFPSTQDVNKLLIGEPVQSGFSMQNTTSPSPTMEYGLLRSQTAFYSNSTSTTPASPNLFIIELKFNSQDNASSYYKAQLFGSLFASNIHINSSNLNLSYGSASYSIFPIGSVSQLYYTVIGHLGSFGFALFLFSTKSSQAQLKGLAELLVQSMQ